MKTTKTLQSLEDIKHITIIGLGQMGYSLALAIKESMPEVIIHGQITSEKEVEQIKKRQDYKDTFKDGGVYSISTFKQSSADLIILAIPINQIWDYLILIHNQNQTCLVTDISSTKKTIIEHWNNLDKEKQSQAQFISSHPMCGSEKIGHRNAQKDLYKEKVIFYCETKNSNTISENIIIKFWEKVANFTPIPINAAYHDLLLANTSHNLHIIAAVLVNNVANITNNNSITNLACAGGFRDMTRIASSSPIMWNDITKNNKEEISKSLKNIIDNLTSIKNKIDNDQSILETFSEAKGYRDQFFTEEY